MKTYKSKSGKQFRIEDFPKPSTGDVIYITPAEFDFIKSSNMTPEEFDYIWHMRMRDYTFEIIPKSEKLNAKELAIKYATQIKEMLMGKKDEQNG
jgi:hypothetical protein